MENTETVNVILPHDAPEAGDVPVLIVESQLTSYPGAPSIRWLNCDAMQLREMGADLMRVSADGRTITINKRAARLVTEKETEDELVLRIESKQ